MSQENNLSLLLNLKDENTKIDCTKVYIKDVKAKVAYGSLTYQPQFCYHCGPVFDKKIIKHGFKMSTIPLQPVYGVRSYLKLRKKRINVNIVDVL